MYSKTQAGFTLTELMIAVTLGSLILLAAFSCFSVAKQFIMRQNAEIRIEESRIMLHQWMAPLVHKAGSFQCAFFNENLIVTSEPGLRVEDWLGSKPLEVLNVEGMKENTLISSALLRRMKIDSPVLWTKHAESPFDLYDTFDSEKGYLEIKGVPDWQVDDVLVLSDCSQILIMRIKELHLLKSRETTRVAFKPFVHQGPLFSLRAKLSKLRSIFYFIGDNILYQYNLNTHRAEPLLEGLEAWDVSIRKENQLEVGAWLHSVEPAFAEEHAFIKQGIQYQDRLMHQQASYSWRILGWV